MRRADTSGPGDAAHWRPGALPDLTGRRALVTGVTSGLGTQTARELARAGATVVLAARSTDRLAITRAGLEAAVPGARFEEVRIDLADLGSVRRAAAQAATRGPLHLLVNNAGVMALPYSRTVDGFELQFATNHLGHFLLTGLLLPQLVASGEGRVVAVSSNAHRLTRRAPVEDPRAEPVRYSRWGSYARSKLANLMFAYELERRLRRADLPVKALAAHPGYSATELMGKRTGPVNRLLQRAMDLTGQPAELGALPSLMAATADLPGGSYVGPADLFEMRGLPRVVSGSRLARNPALQRRLWELSEAATGIQYP